MLNTFTTKETTVHPVIHRQQQARIFFACKNEMALMFYASDADEWA